MLVLALLVLCCVDTLKGPEGIGREPTAAAPAGAAWSCAVGGVLNQSIFMRGRSISIEGSLVRGAAPSIDVGWARRAVARASAIKSSRPGALIKKNCSKQVACAHLFFSSLLCFLGTPTVIHMLFY